MFCFEPQSFGAGDSLSVQFLYDEDRLRPGNHRRSRIPQLVWEPEYDPDIVLDLNAMSIEKSWTIAPLTNGNYGSFDKQRRPTHRFEAQDFPIVADHRMQLNRAFNPLLHGFQGVRGIDAFEQPTGL